MNRNNLKLWQSFESHNPSLKLCITDLPVSYAAMPYKPLGQICGESTSVYQLINLQKQKSKKTKKKLKSHAHGQKRPFHFDPFHFDPFRDQVSQSLAGTYFSVNSVTFWWSFSSEISWGTDSWRSYLPYIRPIVQAYVCGNIPTKYGLTYGIIWY